LRSPLGLDRYGVDGMPERERDPFLSSSRRAVMQRGPSVLNVYEAGESTIVGFSRQSTQQPADIPRLHSDLLKLIDQHRCVVLTFDLTGVLKMPNAVLDIMFSLKQRGVQVQVFNPTKTMRELLKVTRLNGLVREVDQLYAESA
jgi:hypothetical protein